ncbi:hypothetical protein F506_17800 [Herbaspirillum hiltneri N3]|uniref:DUF2726 domain-containing protein n=1 Tax=Herbaspirillum hiltneri N3 TaxID=1262470 RepID=A0ABM5V3S7_9BURK|nr:hypothetical protein F506_17800 [Herbaspirillum hiltneri N3]
MATLQYSTFLNSGTYDDVEALNQHVVLGQVAFSAMLKTKSRATRNRFDRKIADFVILSKAFEVLAVIELDDASHKNRERLDRERQALLTDAGYRVIRYNNVPNVEQVRKDFGIVAQDKYQLQPPNTFTSL